MERKQIYYSIDHKLRFKKTLLGKIWNNLGIETTVQRLIVGKIEKRTGPFRQAFLVIHV